MPQQVTRWWWVRHAPVVGHDGRIYGNNDVPADVSDREAFSRLAAGLPRDAVWVSSHLQRARHTLAAITEHAATAEPGAEALVESDLAEQSFGDWQGMTWEEVQAQGSAEVRHKFWIAPAATRPPGGERFVDVIARVAAVVERLTVAHAGRDIVAVTHGGTIRAALAIALDLDPGLALGFATENLSTTRIDHVSGPGHGGNWRVGFVNLRP